MAKGKYQYWLTPDGLLLIKGWARDGLTDEEIAKKIGISKQTFYDWQKKFPDFTDSIKKNKELADREVEQALFRKAIGYRVKEVTREREFNPVTRKKELVVVKEIEKEVAPDTTAQIFWLKNRKPNEWRDKREVENTTPTNAFDSVREITGKMLDMQEDRSLDDFLKEGGDGNE